MRFTGEGNDVDLDSRVSLSRKENEDHVMILKSVFIHKVQA